MQVSFENIDQSYGKQSLFSGLNLMIPSGKLFTLLGPSGCGKTSLLRMLAGFVRPDGGRILFGGSDVTAIPVHRRGVGMVFQDYALFPDRSILANVCYGLSARGMPKEQAIDRAMAMLKRVGLAAFADRAPMALSGGQRQRVAMARALVIEPKLLLLDEPLSALDVKLRVELRGMIRDLQQEAGITTVFVTHDQEEALAMSDLIAVMDRGRVVQLGAPLEIYSRPCNTFVADFVGSANLIEVSRELPAAGGLRRLMCTGGVLLTDSAVPFQPGVRLAVRSEEIHFAETGAPQDGQVAGIVDHVEFRGGQTSYTVKTETGVITVTASGGNRQRIRERGEKVLLQLPSDAHLVEAS
ncbi:ABC transporter ATP-binding protein [Pantoea cypripedii]|uniref:ABC transporter ATP-binding protein n=1 Tax=Pantoea cypripedii TaxID=55209 RepID=A0A6B9G8T3_PANCY|nr:ABC transporter ATP-binding protein [Pantoea cypripedii]QGY32932.1 ABC transporter ATP-binding protein [Pantoea cypripedii]